MYLCVTSANGCCLFTSSLPLLLLLVGNSLRIAAGTLVRISLTKSTCPKQAATCRAVNPVYTRTRTHARTRAHTHTHTHTHTDTHRWFTETLQHSFVLLNLYKQRSCVHMQHLGALDLQRNAAFQHLQNMSVSILGSQMYGRHALLKGS